MRTDETNGRHVLAVRRFRLAKNEPVGLGSGAEKGPFARHVETDPNTNIKKRQS